MNEHYHKGLEYAQKELYDKAIKEFNRSLLLNPGHMECYFNRGMAKFRLEKYLDSIQDFDQASNFAPNNADIYSQRGVAKHLIKQNEAALLDMDKSLALEPQNPYRYTSRAYIRAKMGDVLSAVDDYKIALKLDPEDAIAWNNLGMLEQSLGMKQSAEERFKQADQIADEGQEFEKPDLDELIKEAKDKANQRISIAKAAEEERKSKGLPASKPLENIPSDEVKIEEITPQPLTVGSYVQTLKEVLFSKEGFTDFKRFLREDLLGKK